MIKSVSIVGARPQFIKLSPVSRAMAHVNAGGARRIDDTIVHTGQHYDEAMSQIFFDEMEIPKPAIDLEVGSASHGVQTGRMLEAIEAVLLDRRPDVVIVYGDTNSTLAGTLAAAKLNIPVAHVEAGLRSFDRSMPEETNRIVADHLGDILFAPTQTAMDNLARENLRDRAVLSGDVMLDAVNFFRDLAGDRSRLLADLQLAPREFAVATLHRAGNTDSERLFELLGALNAVAADHLPVVFPVHPRTVARIRSACPDWQPEARLRMIDPVGYLDMIALVSSSALVLTDSGGLQKEAFFLGAPCVTLRDETEWTETLAAGRNVLVGADPAAVLGAVSRIMESRANRNDVSPAGPDGSFGDGRAAERIVAAVLDFVQEQRHT